MKTLICLVLTLTLAPLLAQTNTVAPATTNEPSVFTRGWNNLSGMFKQQVAKDMATEFYKAGKLDLDLSATYTAVGGPNFSRLWTSDFKHGVWGANLGTIFWISKYFGTGIELGVLNINDPGSYFFDYGAVDVKVQYPIGRLAPYTIGSVGRNFDKATYFYGAGAGVSFALTERARLFTDARFMWQEVEAENGLLARFGLTLTF